MNEMCGLQEEEELLFQKMQHIEQSFSGTEKNDTMCGIRRFSQYLQGQIKKNVRSLFEVQLTSKSVRNMLSDQHLISQLFLGEVQLLILNHS